MNPPDEFRESLPSVLAARARKLSGPTGMSRREILGGAMAFAASATVLAACGSSSSSSTVANLGEAEGDITIGAFADPAAELIRDGGFLTRFTEETGIKARWVQTDYDAWFQKATLEARSGTGTFDVMILDDPWIPQMASQASLQSLEDLGMTADGKFVGETLDLGYWPPRSGPVPPTAQGETPAFISVPMIGDVMSTAFRTDIYSGVPKTWDEVIAVAKEWYDESKRRYAWAYPGEVGASNTSAFAATLFSYSGEFVDDEWKIIYNNPAGVEALERHMELAEYAPRDMTSWSWDQMGASMIRGELSSASFFQGWMANLFDSAQSKFVPETGATTPPAQTKSSSLIGLFMGSVPKGASNAAGGARFLQWWTSPEIQVDYARAGGVPVRPAAFKDKQAQQNAPYLTAAGQSLGVGQPRPRTPEWAQVEEYLSIELNKALTQGGKDGAQAYLDRAADSGTEILDRAGYYS